MPAVYTVMTLDLYRWPDGMEPVWTLLDPDSMQALSAEPSPDNRALRLAPDLDKDALGNSMLVRNARILLEEIAGGEPLWISFPSGCLMMKCVTRLRGLTAWPGLEATEHFRKGKTYREQAVKEVHLLRLLVESAGLIRPGGLWFELTPLGRRMLEPGQRGALQALLFRHAFWHLDLSRFLPIHNPYKLPVAVAAGADRRDPVGAVGRGGGLAEQGHAHHVVQRDRRRDGGIAVELGVGDVRYGAFCGRCTGSGCWNAGNGRTASMSAGARARCLTGSCRSMWRWRTTAGRVIEGGMRGGSGPHSS